jgi:hypothetical protein
MSVHEDARTAIRSLLQSAHAGHSYQDCLNPDCGWVPLYQITNLPHTNQYGARISELRHDYGLNVQNKMGGADQSWFRIVGGTWEQPERISYKANLRIRTLVSEAVARDDQRELRKQPTLFSELSELHRDLG